MGAAERGVEGHVGFLIWDLHATGELWLSSRGCEVVVLE